MIGTIPSFSRVEISFGSKRDLSLVAAELRRLAGEIDAVAKSSDSEEAALILAHSRIKATSKKLRTGTQ